MPENASLYHIGLPVAVSDAGCSSQPFSIDYFKLDSQCESSDIRYHTASATSCRLVFCLHGAINWLVFQDRGIKKVTLGAGCFLYDVCPGRCRRAICASKKEARLLQLCFSHKALAVLLGDAQILPLFPLSKASTPAQVAVQPISLPMNRIIGDIKHTFRSEDGGHLFVLAKSLELLALCCRSEFTDHRLRLGAEDRKAIQAALTILQDNLEKPPSLVQLAAEIGMSVSKLKSLFPKIYGRPPYVYLRQLRMEKAMSLLVDGSMNVTEVAMEVGYNSISYFTKAFYRQFGVYPSQARRQAGRRPIGNPESVKAAG